MNQRDTLVASSRAYPLPSVYDAHGVDRGALYPPLPEFLELLAGYRIERVADVRRFPGSRSQPQYQQAALEPALHRAGIEYRWLPDLGGRRPPIPDTLNTTWRHPSFRGYADHMARSTGYGHPHTSFAAC